MANAYTWEFNFDVYNQPQNGHVDCISRVHWRLTATSDSVVDEDGKPVSVAKYGIVGVKVPEEDVVHYITFDDITPEWAKSKVLASLNKTEADMKKMLDARILKLAMPDKRHTVPASWGV